MTRRLMMALVCGITLAASLTPGAVTRGAPAMTEPFADPGRALVTPAPLGAALPRQDDDPTRLFVWVEYGVTFTLPESWQTLTGAQDFDLALVSPEAMQGGLGAFITVQSISALGAGATLESALGPLAEQLSSEVVAFSAAGLEGSAVNFTDNEAGTLHHLVLLPYGDRGAALYFQTSAPADQDAVVMAILDSMVIDPPLPDYAALDAAWQKSLAENGTLVYGDSDAPISMIEYLSFTCPHCASYSAAIEHLIALEVETGRVRIEIAPLVGDQMALLATKATYCATEQGKGYSAYEALLQGYLSLGAGTAYTPEGVRDLLEPLELDMDALNACIDSDAYDGALDAVRTRFLDAGLNATPTVLIAAGDGTPETLKLPDGQMWSGTVPIAVLRTIFQTMIDDGLSVADATLSFFNQ